MINKIKSADKSITIYALSTIANAQAIIKLIIIQIYAKDAQPLKVILRMGKKKSRITSK